MAKRFTDTDKWKKPWFRKLPLEYKSLWSYICDNCDPCGVWDEDLEAASFHVGYEYDHEKSLNALQKQVTEFKPGKWFIKDFILFQYGRLSWDCKPHLPVYQALQKHGIDIDSIEMSDDIGKTHNISEKNRKLILKRDGDKCCYCQNTVTEDNLTLDHIIPRIKGGKDKTENLVVSCQSCNYKKGDLDLDVFCNKYSLDFQRVSERVSERVSSTLKEKDKEKDKDKDKDKKGGVGENKTHVEDLPDWIEPDAWIGFLEMRKKIKKPLTDRAVTLIFAELTKLKDQGENITAVLDQSTRNNWQDVYPVKSNSNSTVKEKSLADRYPKL